MSLDELMKTLSICLKGDVCHICLGTKKCYGNYTDTGEEVLVDCPDCVNTQKVYKKEDGYADKY